MKTIDPKLISKEINQCYLNYDPSWPNSPNEVRIHSFKYYIERHAGLKLDFAPATDRLGRVGYEIRQIEIVDEPRFTMWILKWA